ncbi:MAG: hypothetical protein IT366_16660 [Candidatus Hydrogenedentes bacterium]|nr:hypothetical protein [Candidatus Hydrogenedentota bacterium]
MKRIISICLAMLATVAAAAEIDLTNATIVAPKSEHDVYADFLADEIELRTGLRLPISNKLPTGPDPMILLVQSDALNSFGVALPDGLSAPDTKEAYAIWSQKTGSSTTIVLTGHPDRGVLFAAGRMIRLLHLADKRISIDESVRIATAPHAPIRGHQIGYRNTPNAYDAWSVAQYEQYLRDQAIFGGNAIEFTPSLAEHERGPHMKKSTWEMTGELIALYDKYNLDSWIWQEIPTRVDLSDPRQAQEHLQDWRVLLNQFKGLDAVFVPGGDGGLTPAPILMPFLEKLRPVINEIIPNATLWVSNQTFEFDENDFLFDYLQKQKPKWLTGVVYGPWTKLDPIEMRERTPSEYPIRYYGDITHNVRCQYPIPEWDRAFAHGLNREAPNPRPQDTYHIFNHYAKYIPNSISYSEGVNDDLNKFIWTTLGWDPETPLETILHDYGKVFFGETESDAVAQGLLMLEQNWRGPIASNDGIAKTLDHWKNIAARSGAKIESNWRLQMYLMRAHYDAYLKIKVAQEMKYETDAYKALARAKQDGVDKAISAARESLAQIDGKKPAPEHRAEIEKLCAMLFKTIGMQLSVDPPYYASGPERGAVLDTLDYPLNNRRWLEKQFDELLKLSDNAERLARIDSIVNWENPGPGGFYDDLGNPQKQPRLVHQREWKDDPGYVDSPQCEYGFGIDKVTRAITNDRLSWLDQATTLYKTPLRMHYDSLDKTKKYRIRVSYAGRFKPTMKLTADGTHIVHDYLPQPETPWPIEFEVPAETTSDGILDLEWQISPDKPEELRHRPLNRGCQVAEVWLIPNS